MSCRHASVQLQCSTLHITFSLSRSLSTCIQLNMIHLRDRVSCLSISTVHVADMWRRSISTVMIELGCHTASPDRTPAENETVRLSHPFTRREQKHNININQHNDKSTHDGPERWSWWCADSRPLPKQRRASPTHRDSPQFYTSSSPVTTSNNDQFHVQ